MREHGPFGGPRRAGGVDDGGEVVRTDATRA